MKDYDSCTLLPRVVYSYQIVHTTRDLWNFANMHPFANAKLLSVVGRNKKLIPFSLSSSIGLVKCRKIISSLQNSLESNTHSFLCLQLTQTTGGHWSHKHISQYKTLWLLFLSHLASCHNLWFPISLHSICHDISSELEERLLKGLIIWVEQF